MANPVDIVQGTNATPVNPTTYNIIVDRINYLGNRVFDIVDYGAVVDGVTDDTAAIQAAADAADANNGGIVYHPGGDCFITSALELGDNTRLIGAGREVSSITGNLDTGMIRSKDIAQTHYRLSVESLLLDNTDYTTNGGKGIDFTKVWYGVIRDVYIQNAQTGIRISGPAYYNEIINVSMDTLREGIIMVALANENHVWGGRIHTCSTGIYLDDVSNVQIYGTALEGFNIIGVDIGFANWCSSPKLVGLRLESLNRTGVRLGTLSHGVFVGLYFQALTTNIDYGSNTDTIVIGAYDGFDRGNDLQLSGDLSVLNASPDLLLQNITDEDADDGRESMVRFKGQQSGSEETTLATIVASHDGAADDEKGKLEFSTNDTNDGNTPTLQMTLNSVDMTLARGILALQETTTPTPVATQGRLYTKSDNNIYFQDGAGAEHTILKGATSIEHTYIAPLEDPTGTVGNWDVVSIGTSQSVHFALQVPEDFEFLDAANVIIIPDANETIQWDVLTSVAAAGEAYDNDDRSALNETLAVTINLITEVDISGVLTGLTAGDYIAIDFQSDTAVIRVVGFEFDYN